MLEFNPRAILDPISSTAFGLPLLANDDGGDGGSGGGAGSGDDGGAGDGGKGKGGADDDGGDLRDAGKRALAAERDARKAAEDRAKAAEAKLQEHEDAKLGETERLGKKLADAESENLHLKAELNDAKVDRAIERAALQAGFIDAEDAVMQVNRTLLTIDSDGIVKSETLETALKDLADRKPHLLGESNGRGGGSWDGGNRGSGPKGGKGMNELIRESAGLSG